MDAKELLRRYVDFIRETDPTDAAPDYTITDQVRYDTVLADPRFAVASPGAGLRMRTWYYVTPSDDPAGGFWLSDPDLLPATGDWPVHYAYDVDWASER
jgi:hypothetical protein